MQVTKRYEIPRVASIKGYEDQRVPMTKGCIVIPRMQCIVIQDLRSCRDPRGTNVLWSKRYKRVVIQEVRTYHDPSDVNGSWPKGYKRVGTESVRTERDRKGYEWFNGHKDTKCIMLSVDSHDGNRLSYRSIHESKEIAKALRLVQSVQNDWCMNHNPWSMDDGSGRKG